MVYGFRTHCGLSRVHASRHVAAMDRVNYLKIKNKICLFSLTSSLFRAMFVCMKTTQIAENKGETSMSKVSVDSRTLYVSKFHSLATAQSFAGRWETVGLLAPVELALLGRSSSEGQLI